MRKLLLLSALLALLPGCAVSPSGVSLDNHVMLSMKHDGLERRYLLSKPESASRVGARPLIIALHGGRGSPERMVEMTLGGLDKLAAKDGAIVVYPEGIDQRWNDGRQVPTFRAHKDRIDDVGFILRLIDRLAERENANPKKVFVIGASDGAIMAQRLACEKPKHFRAVVSVVGTMPYNVIKRRCKRRPLSVMIINGTADPIVPWKGGSVGIENRKHGIVLSAADNFRYWQRRNKCVEGAPPVLLPDVDPDDATRVFRYTASPCRRKTKVELLEIRGGGHTWPSGWQYLPELVVGRTSKDIDASKIAWDFIRQKF